jgi:predicted transposase YbfD/YdcC
MLWQSTGSSCGARSITPAASRRCKWFSAWGCEQRLMLAQIATDAKSNEITAGPELLEMVSSKGTIVTTDALNCQRAIARQIVDQDGNYVMALKGNPGILHDDVSTTSTTRHAKLPRPNRTLMPITDASRRVPPPSRPTSTGCSRIITGPASPQSARWSAFAKPPPKPPIICSAQRGPANVSTEVVREHRGVENRLHWRLDVVMNGDQHRNRLGYGPNNLAVLRHIALNGMQKEPPKGSLHGKFKRAGRDDAYLTKLLALF